jgi:RNA polymerase sigma-70 factor (ECF subfamily)
LAELINIGARFATTERNVSGQSELSVLIKDCIAQSLSAQKKLYDLYAPAAYGVIKRYSFQGAFEGWIRRIVVNTVTDHLRKNIKDDQQHKEIKPEDVYVGSDSVEKLSHKELLKLIETLPDTQRLVFNLYVFENYSHKEIGTVLDINENNSRWHLNDARRRLKEKINNLMK